MFKLSLAASLLFVAMVTTAPVKAQTIENNLSASNSHNIAPRQLISLARQGRFKDQDIPSHSNFGSGVRSGRITAEVLVESAISQSRLPQSARRDRNYLNAVAKHLNSGGCSST